MLLILDIKILLNLNIIIIIYKIILFINLFTQKIPIINLKYNIHIINYYDYFN